MKLIDRVIEPDLEHEHDDSCIWCGLMHGGSCPEIAAMDFYPDGEIKRVEFLRGKMVEDTNKVFVTYTSSPAKGN